MKRLFVASLIGSLAAPAVRAADVSLPDLVNRKVLRVCAAPGNMPMSDEKEEGFENKIAKIVADELKIPIENVWYPQGMGLVRQTLNKKKCDLVIGTAQTDEFTLNTNHYYRTSYSLVYRPGGGLDGLDSLFDPRLADKHVGVQAGAPPTDYAAKAGLTPLAKSYTGMPDRRYYTPEADMIKDLVAGEIDVALLWGPFAGYYAKQSGEKLVVVPMIKDEQTGHEGWKGPKLTYRITMGVRPSDTGWKRQLNSIIAKRQGDIDAVLLEYSVPLIDEQDKQITAARR